MKLNISYKRLRHLLVEYNMNMADLRNVTGIGRNTTASLNLDRPVSLETLLLICEYFECKIEDVVEFVSEKAERANGDQRRFRYVIKKDAE